ncbi:hypothetical protein NDU88_004827 [Pleurodeles waltl]|uniref:Uncharacterized protein n=1 Tax=Pleurodeles waltl TaxID=8319 RepID=A0AAV7UG85_PLEWA|nr:hypothetical protein NDU88_004827 [Pleurodeles waltl]
MAAPPSLTSTACAQESARPALSPMSARPARSRKSRPHRSRNTNRQSRQSGRPRPRGSQVCRPPKGPRPKSATDLVPRGESATLSPNLQAQQPQLHRVPKAHKQRQEGPR